MSSVAVEDYEKLVKLVLKMLSNMIEVKGSSTLVCVKSKDCMALAKEVGYTEKQT